MPMDSGELNDLGALSRHQHEHSVVARLTNYFIFPEVGLVCRDLRL